MSALKIKKGSSKHSAYNLRPNFSDVTETHNKMILGENVDTKGAIKTGGAVLV